MTVSLDSRTKGLHAIVDVEVAQRLGWSPLSLATAYLAGGARIIQLRAKSLAGAAFLDMAQRLHEMTKAAGAVLIVNDRADIAKLAGAEGVHVGQDDVPPAAARAIVGSEALLGLSTHTESQVARAVHEPIAYLAIGPVFGTSTKATGYDAIGLERVRRAAQIAQPLTLNVIAIGGVTLENAAAVLDAGATGVAVIADLLAGDDPEARVRAYLALIAEAAKV